MDKNYIRATGEIFNSPRENLVYSLDWVRLGGNDWELTFDFDASGEAGPGLDTWLFGEFVEVDECETISSEELKKHLENTEYIEIGVWPLHFDEKESELETVYFKNVSVTIEAGGFSKTFDTNVETTLTF